MYFPCWFSQLLLLSDILPEKYQFGTTLFVLSFFSRRELITPKSQGGGTQDGFEVAKTGDARIGFIGFPSVGKSTLLSNLAGVYSEVAAYEFTTLTTVPGCIKYKGAKIQLLDLPGIIEGAKDGKGRGRQVSREKGHFEFPDNMRL